MSYFPPLQLQRVSSIDAAHILVSLGQQPHGFNPYPWVEASPKFSSESLQKQSLLGVNQFNQTISLSPPNTTTTFLNINTGSNIGFEGRSPRSRSAFEVFDAKKSPSNSPSTEADMEGVEDAAMETADESLTDSDDSTYSAPAIRCKPAAFSSSKKPGKSPRESVNRREKLSKLVQHEAYVSQVECGHVNIHTGERVFAEYVPLFNKEVPVYTAVKDPHRRKLFKASDLSKIAGRSNNMLSMHLARNKSKLESGIYQASEITHKKDSSKDLRVGGYFFTIDACEKFLKHAQRTN